MKTIISIKQQSLHGGLKSSNTTRSTLGILSSVITVEACSDKYVLRPKCKPRLVPRTPFLVKTYSRPDVLTDQSVASVIYCH